MVLGNMATAQSVRECLHSEGLPRQQEEVEVEQSACEVTVRGSIEQVQQVLNILAQVETLGACSFAINSQMTVLRWKLLFTAHELVLLWCHLRDCHTTSVRFQTAMPLVSGFRLPHHWCQVSDCHTTGVGFQTATPLVSGLRLLHHWCQVSDYHTTGVRFQTATSFVSGFRLPHR